MTLILLTIACCPRLGHLNQWKGLTKKFKETPFPLFSSYIENYIPWEDWVWDVVDFPLKASDGGTIPANINHNTLNCLHQKNIFNKQATDHRGIVYLLLRKEGKGPLLLPVGAAFRHSQIKWYPPGILISYSAYAEQLLAQYSGNKGQCTVLYKSTPERLCSESFSGHMALILHEDKRRSSNMETRLTGPVEGENMTSSPTSNGLEERMMSPVNRFSKISRPAKPTARPPTPPMAKTEFTA